MLLCGCAAVPLCGARQAELRALFREKLTAQESRLRQRILDVETERDEADQRLKQEMEERQRKHEGLRRERRARERAEQMLRTREDELRVRVQLIGHARNNM